MSTYSISFGTRVCFSKPITRADKFYQACEWYYSLGGRKATVLNEKKKKHSFIVKLEKTHLSRKKLFKAVVIRIAIGATGIVPLIALLGKTHFRRNNLFEVISSNDSISVNIAKKNRTENEILSKFKQDVRGRLKISNIADLKSLSKNVQVSFFAKNIPDVFFALKDSRVVELTAKFLEMNGKVFKEFAAILKENQTLVFLDLYGNQIGPKGAKELAGVLKTNRKLTSLDLSVNDIGLKGAKELAALLKENQTLTSLELARNEIGVEGAKELAAALKVNRTLTSLNLNVNPLSFEGAKEIVVALKENRILTTLFLFCCIDDGRRGEIKEMLWSNTTLEIKW